MWPFTKKKTEDNLYLQYESLMTPQEKAERDAHNEAKEAAARRKRQELEQDWALRKEAISDFIKTDGFQQFAFYAVCVVVGILVIVGIIALVRHFQEQKQWVGTISELHYKREKYIEEYQAVSGGDWWNAQPPLSYDNHYIDDRIRSYHTEYYLSVCTRSKSSTDSKGHTTYRTETYPCTKSKQVPDYDKWYGYTINRWGVVKTIDSEERQNRNELTLQAVWPTPDGLIREFGTSNCTEQQLGTAKLKIIEYQKTEQSQQKTDPLLGCQRVSPNQNEWYWITYSYTADKKPFNFECQIDYSSWTPLRVGKSAWGKYYVHNEGFDCNDGHIGDPPKETPEGK